MGFEDYQPVRLRIGQGLDDPGIDVAENGSVRSNAQRQCQNSNRGERSILRQHSRAIAQVLPKRLHQPLPASGSSFTLLFRPTAYKEPNSLLEPDTIEVIQLRHV